MQITRAYENAQNLPSNERAVNNYATTRGTPSEDFVLVSSSGILFVWLSGGEADVNVREI